MSVLIWMVAILALLYGFARIGLSVEQWLAMTGMGLFVLILTGATGLFPGVLAAAVWLGVLAFTRLPKLRREWFMRPALDYLKRNVPPMSETERIAIEAGTVWWDAELFGGNPDFSRLIDYPASALTETEQAFINGPVETLCRMIDDWHITHDLNRLPDEVWAYMRRERFFGMIIPEVHGGLGFSALAHSAVVMKVASRSISAAVTVMVPNSLGPAELLLHYGTEAQKQHFLPRLARGEEIPCFALTGPEAGSDAGAIPDYGVVCKGMHEGREVLGLKVNWDKRYITLGPVATILGLAFKAWDPDHLLGGDEELGITCALIPVGTAGVEIGQRHYPLNAAFQNGPNRGRDVFVPMEWIIGGQACIGDGWRMLMESLATGRSISLPALSVAGAKHAVRVTGAYARVRKQFHLPVGQFEGVEEVLARMGGYAYIMEAARQLTTTALDQGERPSVISAMLKYNLTEMMRTVLNDAMDVHGGRGICMGPANYLGRTYQSIPISITVEGANILTRGMIIFGQGAMRCHPWLLRELRAAHEADPDKALADFDKAIMRHMGYSLRNAARGFVYGLSAGHLAPRAHQDPVLNRYYQQLHRMSSAFAITADLALLSLGGALKRREKLSGRFADALSHLYLGSAVLKQFADQGRPKADLPLLHWSMQHVLFNIQTALDGVIRHFPLKPLRWLLRIVVFPLGRRYQPPHDRLGREIARLIMQPGEARDRLITGIYRTDDPDDITGRLEYALSKTLQAEPVEKRLREAQISKPYDEPYEAWVDRLSGERVLADHEAGILQEAWRAVHNAIRVDEFPQNKNSVDIHHDEAA